MIDLSYHEGLCGMCEVFHISNLSSSHPLPALTMDWCVNDPTPKSFSADRFML
jgi:hypothetical protein